ncbi:MAG: aldehyde dehydrogenase, partial [Candidatus Dormibacteraeota bacterium]|nr:aldehyde dehydrogenase [Candidatus Dormibacteraeota bacterium]
MTETQTQTTAGGTGVGRSPMLIGGEWVESQDGRWLSVESPARRGSVIREVPRGGAADVDRA